MEFGSSVGSQSINQTSPHGVFHSLVRTGPPLWHSAKGRGENVLAGLDEMLRPWGGVRSGYLL
jgi:hypothetical protein